MERKSLFGKELQCLRLGIANEGPWPIAKNYPVKRSHWHIVKRSHWHIVNIDSTGSPAVLSQRLFDHYNLLHSTASATDPPVTTLNFSQHSSTTVNSSSLFMAPLNLNILSTQSFEFQTFLRQELWSYLSRELPRVLPQQRSDTASSTSLHIVPSTIHNGIPNALPQEPPSMFNLFFQPNPASATTTSLPPISSAILERIQACKLNLSKLNFTFDLRWIHDQSVFRFREPAVSLVPKAQNRPCVDDFHTWMMTMYIYNMIYYHPQCISYLVRYQSIVTSQFCQPMHIICMVYLGPVI